MWPIGGTTACKVLAEMLKDDDSKGDSVFGDFRIFCENRKKRISVKQGLRDRLSVVIFCTFWNWVSISCRRAELVHLPTYGWLPESNLTSAGSYAASAATEVTSDAAEVTSKPA